MSVAFLLFLVVPAAAQNESVTTAKPRLGIPAISKEAQGAVVSIIMSDEEGRPIAQGSGFFVSTDGKVVTNYHVIRTGSSGVIKLPSGAFYAVRGVLALNVNRDIAVIQASGHNFRTLILGDSDRVQVGEEVVAIGSPRSLESTVSNGIVSAIRDFGDENGKLLQTTAPISPGSSGGPLFDMAGKVVGITSARLEEGEALNFAVPINDVKSILAAKASRLSSLPNEAESIHSEKVDGPSLADTLQWIKDSANNGSGILGIGDRSESHSFIYPDGVSCSNFKIVSNTFFQTQPYSMALSHTVVLDLADVDPASIKGEWFHGQNVIQFSTTNSQDKISAHSKTADNLAHLRSGQLKWQGDRLYHEWRLLIDDTEYSSRLVKALQHAVILCGGKPSAF